jgi:hypothetical protein
MAGGIVSKIYGMDIVTTKGEYRPSPSDFSSIYGLYQKYMEKNGTAPTHLNADDMFAYSASDTLMVKPRQYGKSATIAILDEYATWDVATLNTLVKKKEQPMAAYSVGDWVQIIGPDVDGDTNSRMPTGHIGQVTDVYNYDNDSHAGVNDGHSYEIDHGYAYGAARLMRTDKPHRLAVGDRVRLMTIQDCSSGGKFGTVTEVNGENITFTDEDGRTDNSHCTKEFVIVRTQATQGDNMSEVTSNPVKAIMENELDPDTRLLRQIGFENNDGTVADYGRAAVIQSLYAERRADFAAKYRKALATEESAAKVAAEAKAAKA